MKLNDETSFQILEKHGIQVARWHLVRSEDELELIAENTSFPVYMKVDSPEIMSKSAEEMVIKAESKKHAIAAFNDISRRARRKTRNFNGVIMQSFVDGLEANVNVSNDKMFGRVISFGSGGMVSKIVDDSHTRLVPITMEDATALVKKSSISRIMDEGMIMTCAAALLKISEASEELFNIASMSIEPLIISKKGAFVADAKLFV